MLGWRKSHKQPPISGSSIRTDTSFNLPRPSVFCPTTEATAQAIILRAKFFCGGFGGCTREEVAAALVAGQQKSGRHPETCVSSNFSHSYDRITHINCNNLSPAVPTSISMALVTAEDTPTRTFALAEATPIHTPTTSIPILVNRD